jgi:hypothetical protein
MKINYNIIIVPLGLFTLLILSGCTKDNMFDCFKSTGKVITQDRPASQFGGIVLKNNLDLYITQGTSYSITVEAGKNLQKNIKTEISDNVLTISNDNTCNWVRSYDKPFNVHVTVVDIDSIIYQSSGNVLTLNTLVTDSMKILVKEGAGRIDMDIETQKFFCQMNEGTVDINMHGYADVLFVSSNTYGPLNCLDLYTNFTYLHSNSTNDCYIQVHLEMDVLIDNVGNVYYSGNPGSVNYTQNSSGELIKLD